MSWEKSYPRSSRTSIVTLVPWICQ